VPFKKNKGPLPIKQQPLSHYCGGTKKLFYTSARYLSPSPLGQKYQPAPRCLRKLRESSFFLLHWVTDLLRVRTERKYILLLVTIVSLVQEWVQFGYNLQFEGHLHNITTCRRRLGKSIRPQSRVPFQLRHDNDQTF
jgi:hypothetical protein